MYIVKSPGLLVYFTYGMHHSRENRPAQSFSYGPMVEYTGDAAMPDPSINPISGVVKEQQPARKEEGLYQ